MMAQEKEPLVNEIENEVEVDIDVEAEVDAEIDRELALYDERKKKTPVFRPAFVVANLLFVALMVCIAVPGVKNPPTYIPFYVAVIISEVLFIWRYLTTGRRRSTCNIISVVWVIFIIWEVCATDLGIAHPVLIPLPENVFNVFPRLFYPEIVRHVTSSLTLLAEGFLTGLIAATLLGLFIGWLPKVAETVYPIANMMSVIPAIVFTPYLVMLLPTFRMAGATVIFLNVFWGTLISTMQRVQHLDRRILDSTKMMGLGTFDMVFKVLIPYMYPTIVGGLKGRLPSGMLMLMMAEMYGATSGMGYFIINYTNYANYTNVVAGIILIGVVVTILHWLVGLLVRKTVKWTE